MLWWHVLSGSWPFKSQNSPKHLWQVCPMIPPAFHPQQNRDKNWDDGQSFSYSCHLSCIWTKLRVKSYLLVGGFKKNPHICPSNYMIRSFSVTIYERTTLKPQPTDPQIASSWPIQKRLRWNSMAASGVELLQLPLAGSSPVLWWLLTLPVSQEMRFARRTYICRFRQVSVHQF